MNTWIPGHVDIPCTRILLRSSYKHNFFFSSHDNEERCIRRSKERHPSLSLHSDFIDLPWLFLFNQFIDLSVGKKFKLNIRPNSAIATKTSSTSSYYDQISNCDFTTMDSSSLHPAGCNMYAIYMYIYFRCTFKGFRAHYL